MLSVCVEQLETRWLSSGTIARYGPWFTGADANPAPLVSVAPKHATSISRRAAVPSAGSGQIQTDLIPPSALPFSWGDFSPKSNVANIQVTDYRKKTGAPAGGVYSLDSQVYAQKGSPRKLAKLGLTSVGTIQWRYVIYRGSMAGSTSAIAFVGAALMGGFEPVIQPTDPSQGFAFLQIFSDSTNRNGAIDATGPHGIVNADIPGWSADPTAQTTGWNFHGSSTTFDYLDVPSDDPTARETVALETALVSYSGSTVQILDDVKWTFTGNGKSGVRGQPVRERAQASETLLRLYRDANPTFTYLNIGQF